MSKKNKKEKVMPSIFAWFIYSTASQILLKFLNKVKIDRKAFKNRNKKEGCIVLYNHTSKYDHFLTTAAFRYTRAAYVISTHFYFKSKIRVLLKLVRAIPKEQFKSDISTIKKIKRALQHKLPVAIAPVGQITMHGECLHLDKSIVKLLKMCNVDVYTATLHGSYFAWPKWMIKSRKNPVLVKFDKLFDKEQLKQLSEDEIYSKVYTSLDVVDRNEVDKYNYNLKPENLILGIEDMLYKCPKCNSKDSLTTVDNIITCHSCGYSVKMNSRGVFEKNSNDEVLFDNEAKWYNWEKEEILENVKNNTLYLTGTFDIYHNINKDYELVNLGTGNVVLTNDELYYEGMFNGEQKRIDFKLFALTQLPFETRNHFAIPSDEGTFEFKPANGEKASKIAQFVQSIEVLSNYKKEKTDNE